MSDDAYIACLVTTAIVLILIIGAIFYHWGDEDGRAKFKNQDLAWSMYLDDKETNVKLYILKQSEVKQQLQQAEENAKKFNVK